MDIRLLSLGALLAASTLAHADFVNGSFESPSIGVAQLDYVSGTMVPGWTLSGTGTIVSNGFDGSGTDTTWYDTPAGNQYLYIQIDTEPGQTASQTVSLAAGANTLSFLQADFKTPFETPGGAIDVSIERASDGAVVVPPTLFTVGDYSTFQAQSLAFTAPTAGGYEFDFISVGGHAGLIDNVSVTAAPEPTPIVALGLGMVAMLRRRKRA